MGNNTIFTLLIVLSASGAMGPSTVAFLKDVYAWAKAAGKFKMTQQLEMKYTWNTMVARLSVTCTSTDAEFQNRINIHDHTMNLPKDI